MAKRQYGVSTHLFHNQRLSRDHLLEIAAQGFELVEVFATRTHFDYHNPATVADLQQWLAEAGLELQSVHAPIAERFSGGRWSGTLSIATPTRGRASAVARRTGAAHRARIAVPVLVAHSASPVAAADRIGVQDRRAAGPRPRCGWRAARRAIAGGAAQRVVEAGSLVHFVEDDLTPDDDGAAPGPASAWTSATRTSTATRQDETVSEHLVATCTTTAGADDHLLRSRGRSTGRRR